MVSWIVDILLAALAVSMLIGGHYGVTRQLAFAPLLTAVLDAVFATQVDLGLTPVLSALLFALQAVILLGGALVLYQDRVRVRNRRARRRRRQELARSRAAFEQAAEQAAHRSAARRRGLCA